MLVCVSDSFIFLSLARARFAGSLNWFSRLLKSQEAAAGCHSLCSAALAFILLIRHEVERP